MIKANNIVPSIAGIGLLVVGVTLIQKHNAIKKKTNSFVEFPEQRSYTELAEFEDKWRYMDIDEFEAGRNYIELGTHK